VIRLSFVSPLTPRQQSVWSLLNKGLSVSKIAEMLKTSRQYVNQTKLSLEAQLSKALLEVAQVNNLQVRRLYSDKAILLGYHPGLNQETVVTYTNNHGIKVWYWHENPEAVTDEVFLRETRQYLLDLAQERGIELTTKEKEKHPARLAQVIFSKLVPELRK
jgi:transcriptional regulator